MRPEVIAKERCVCGHWDNLHLVAEGCQGMGETWDTDCSCREFRPAQRDGSACATPEP